MGEDPSSSRLEEEASALQQEYCDHNEDTAGTVTYCGWFVGLWRRHYSSRGYDDTCHQEEQEELKKDHRNWLVKAALLVEIILEGGSKWKSTFMPRLRSNNKKKNKRMQFQYDPKSYALNFDDGIQKESGDDGGVYLHFSSRYACPLALGLGINNKQ